MGLKPVDWRVIEVIAFCIFPERNANKEAFASSVASSLFVIRTLTPSREAKAARIELLADYFSVPKSSVKVIRGQAGRRKLIEIG